MFKRKVDPIDLLIEGYTEALLKMKPTEDDYVEHIEALSKLVEAKAKAETPSKTLDPNVVLTVVWSIVSTLIIIGAEREDVVGRSKAFSERIKPRIASRI